MKLIGSKEYIWSSSADEGFRNIIPYPNSNQYVSISNKARKKIDQYFSTYFKSYGEPYIEDYLRKVFDLEMLDYSAFREASSGIYKTSVVFDRDLRKAIYDMREMSKHSLVYYLILGFILLTSKFLKNLYFCFRSRQKISIPKIIYLRKKPYDDLGFRDIIFNRLKERHNHQPLGSYITFSSNREDLGNYYLNAFDGSSFRLFRAYIEVLSDLFKTAKIASKNAIGLHRYSQLLSNLLLANYITKLNSVIYFGVLLDKPIFVLLSKFKKDSQKILGINESFFYPPFRSFDYNHLDTYYCMNEIDWSIQNKYGGLIKHREDIEFFRGKLITKSDGLSDELNKLIRSYHYRVILTPIQVASRQNGFLAWSQNDLLNFVKYSLEIAIAHPDKLFILKGKKSELSLLPKQVLKEFYDLSNTFVIKSSKPRDLKFNQYEDLLEYAQLVISMSHTSTTIWQALSNKVPIIAINDSHDPSFLGEYKFLEVSSSKLHEAFNYWINIKPEELNSFIKEISNRVNLGSGNGLIQVADDISKQLKYSVAK